VACGVDGYCYVQVTKADLVLFNWEGEKKSDKRETQVKMRDKRTSGSEGQHLAVAQIRNIAIDGDDNKSEEPTQREGEKGDRGNETNAQWG